MIVCDGPDCGFDDLIELAKAVMNNLTVVAVLLASIVFIWVGYTLLTSQGDTGAMSKAKKALGNVVLGLFIVLAAWLIVYTISSVLLNDGFSILQSIG